MSEQFPYCLVRTSRVDRFITLIALTPPQFTRQTSKLDIYPYQCPTIGPEITIPLIVREWCRNKYRTWKLTKPQKTTAVDWSYCTHAIPVRTSNSRTTQQLSSIGRYRLFAGRLPGSMILAPRPTAATRKHSLRTCRYISPALACMISASTSFLPHAFYWAGMILQLFMHCNFDLCKCFAPGSATSRRRVSLGIWLTNS